MSNSINWKIPYEKSNRPVANVPLLSRFTVDGLVSRKKTQPLPSSPRIIDDCHSHTQFSGRQPFAIHNFIKINFTEMPILFSFCIFPFFSFVFEKKFHQTNTSIGVPNRLQSAQALALRTCIYYFMTFSFDQKTPQWTFIVTISMLFYRYLCYPMFGKWYFTLIIWFHRPQIDCWSIVSFGRDKMNSGNGIHSINRWSVAIIANQYDFLKERPTRLVIVDPITNKKTTTKSPNNQSSLCKSSWFPIGLACACRLHVSYPSQSAEHTYQSHFNQNRILKLLKQCVIHLCTEDDIIHRVEIELSQSSWQIEWAIVLKRKNVFRNWNSFSVKSTLANHCPWRDQPIDHPLQLALWPIVLIWKVINRLYGCFDNVPEFFVVFFPFAKLNIASHCFLILGSVLSLNLN